MNIPAPLFQGILKALSEQDEITDLCKDKNGNPEPDSELCDYENVPLKEEQLAYVVIFHHGISASALVCAVNPGIGPPYIVQTTRSSKLPAKVKGGSIMQ